MKQEYRYAAGWRVILWIIFPALMVLFGYMGITPWVDESTPGMKFFLTLLAVIFEFLIVLGLMDLRKGKLIIEKESITSVGVFKTRTLKLADIKGFKKDDNYLYFIPSSKNHKQIKVSSYFGKFNHLVNWAGENFVNLDILEILHEEEKILSNEDFGSTVEEREELLKKAKRATTVINTIAWISAISLWFLPYFYDIQVVICAALPIIGFVIYKRFRGIIRLDDKPNSANPELLSTLFIPSAALMLRALMDFNVFDYENLWKPALVIFVSLGILLLKDSNVQYNFKKAASYFYVILMLLFGAMYSFGFIITTNSVFDPSQPEYYKAKVLEKRISSGKHKTCYFELSEWGPQQKVEEAEVSRSLYNEKEPGDSAVIFFSKGLYKIPYYMVVE